MSADAWFTGTDEHPVCQDYALANGKQAVLCDGCSGSKHSDWGARFLAYAATQPIPPSTRENVYYSWVRNVALLAANYASLINFHEDALTATLLEVREMDDGAVITVAGDGYVLARFRVGGFEIHRFHAEGEAPLYPCYLLDPQQLKDYCERFGQWEHTTRFVLPDGTVGKSAGLDGGKYWVSPKDGLQGVYPHVLTFPRNDYDVVLVASDGLDRFTQPVPPEQYWGKASRQRAPDTAVCGRIMQFKSLAGEFVQRRMKAEMRVMAEDGWRFSDDVSVAGISMEST